MVPGSYLVGGWSFGGFMLDSSRMRRTCAMNNKNAKDGGRFGKPLALTLVLTGLTGHTDEPIKQDPGTLTELKLQRSIDFVAYLPHGAEPLTEYTFTLKGIVRIATTSP
jgi:hypothetical protein